MYSDINLEKKNSETLKTLYYETKIQSIKIFHVNTNKTSLLRHHLTFFDLNEIYLFSTTVGLSSKFWIIYILHNFCENSLLQFVRV